jgi:hypothetical protein
LPGLYFKLTEYIIRCSTCPQCLETAVRFLLALDLKLNDKVNPTHYAWQAGVGRSLVSHLIRLAAFRTIGALTPDTPMI